MAKHTDAAAVTPQNSTIPIEIQTFSASTGTMNQYRFIIYKNAHHALYQLHKPGWTKDEYSAGFLSREEMEDTWKTLRQKPNFSYVDEGTTKTTLGTLIRHFERGIDPLVDYIDGPEAWKRATIQNNQLKECIREVRDTFYPEYQMYPIFQEDLRQAIRHVAEPLKNFMAGNHQFKRTWPGDSASLTHSAWYGADYAALSPLHADTINHDILPSLQKITEYLQTEQNIHPGDPYDAAESILPGSQNISGALNFLDDLQKTIQDVHTVVHDAKDFENEDLRMQQKFLSMVQTLAEEYPSIPMVQEAYQKLVETDQAYQESNPHYTELLQSDTLFPSPGQMPYEVSSSDEAFLDQLPIIEATLPDHSVLREPLISLSYETRYGSLKELADTPLCEVTIKGQGKALPKGTTLHQAVLQAAVLASQNGALYAEGRPSDTSPNPKYYFFKDAASFLKHCEYPYTTKEWTPGDIKTNKERITKLFYDGKTLWNHSSGAMTIADVNGLVILPAIEKSLKQHPNVEALDEYKRRLAVFHGDFLASAVVFRNDGLQPAMMEPFKTPELTAYVKAFGEIEDWRSQHLRNEGGIIEMDLEVFKKNRDPWIAEILLKDTKKHRASDRQVQKAGKIIQAASPLRFTEGKSYGLKVAKDMMKEHTAYFRNDTSR